MQLFLCFLINWETDYIMCIFICVIGNEQNPMGDSVNIHPGSGPPLPPSLLPQAPWQTHHIRVPWGRPPPMPRDGEHQGMCPSLPPTNMPPPQIRPRGIHNDNCI